MEEKKEFPIIGGRLISSKYAKISHATQNILFQTQGQKGEKKRGAFLATQEHQKNLYLDCPKMKNPTGSNIRKIHHVLDPVEQ